MSSSSRLPATILPSFHLDDCAWNATHIVVVRAGAKIDGVVKVLESWKGDLNRGDQIVIPELADFANPAKRGVSQWILGPAPEVSQVTCTRMVLFLVKKQEDAADAATTSWLPANSWGEQIFVSTVWIENGKAFAFAQMMNPGPTELIPWDSEYEPPFHLDHPAAFGSAFAVLVFLAIALLFVFKRKGRFHQATVSVLHWCHPWVGVEKWNKVGPYLFAFFALAFAAMGIYGALVATGVVDSNKLTSAQLTESGLHCKVMKILDQQAALQEALNLSDSATLAAAVLPVIRSEDRVVSEDRFMVRKVFDGLKKAGPKSLPVLRMVLQDKSLAPLHGYAIDALGQAGGPSVGPELTQFLDCELEFWKAKGPNLKNGWWNGTGLEWEKVDPLRDRYGKSLDIIRSLEAIEFKGCRESVTAFRDYWRSLPQLNEIAQMCETCDDLLKKIR